MFILCLNAAYEGGIYFGFNANVGTIHVSARQVGRWTHHIFPGAIHNVPARWGLDGGMGLSLGYRWVLPPKMFIDWSFLDFSNGLSCVTLRIGGNLGERWSMYGLVTPAFWITDGMFAAMRALDVSEAKAREAFVTDIGCGIGVGGIFRLIPQLSLQLQHTVQMGYGFGPNLKLGNCIRQRFSIGLLVHQAKF